MLLSPYQTVHGSAMQTKQIETDLMRLIIERDVGLKRVHAIDGLPNTFSLIQNADIGIFNQCLLISNRGESFVISDDRQANHSPREALLNELNLKFTSVWMNDGSSILKQSTNLAGRVFVNVVTNAIMQSYKLSLQEMTRIRLASAIYYNSSHYSETPESYKIVRAVKDYTNMSSTDVEDFIRNHTDTITTLNGLAQIIASGNNPALKNFTDISIHTILSSIYFGLNSKEHISVALEYPPRWVSLVALVMQDAGYNRTVLGSTTKKLAQRDDIMLDYVRYILEQK